MTTKVTRVRNGLIKLPSSWKGTFVCIAVDLDTVMIKRMEPPSLSELKPMLKSIGKKISRRDIDRAVQAARREIRKKRGRG